MPAGALGPAANGSGYFVGHIDGNLYWVTLVGAPPGSPGPRPRTGNLGALDPTPFFARYGPSGNAWAAFESYLDAAAERAAAPVVAKYSGLLAPADVFTAANAAAMVKSTRVDAGFLGAFGAHP